MKSLKKILSIFAAFMMVVGLTVANVKADGYSITVENATVGKDYTAIKIFDATYNSSGNAAYTASKDVIEYLTGTTLADTATTASWNSVTFEKNQDGTFNVLGITEDNRTSIAEALATKFKNVDLTNLPNCFVKSETIKATSASVTIPVTSQGLYFVRSTLGGVVTITNANPSQTIIDKNQEGANNFKKEIVTTDGNKKEVSANFGDTIKYQVSFNTTNYYGKDKVLSYTISDQLASGLTYKGSDNNVDVKIEIANKVDGTKEILNVTPNITSSTTGSSFTYTIDWVGNDAEKTPLYTSPAKVTVTYEATVNANAGINTSTNTNSATLQPNTEGTNKPSSSTDSTTVKVYALAINKVDENKNGLGTAEFTLMNQAGKTLFFTIENAGSTGTNAKYIYAGTEDEKIDANNNWVSTITTPANGIVELIGLKQETYTLTETKAPNGYNILEGGITVNTTQIGESTTQTTVYYDENGDVSNTETETTSTVTTSVNAQPITVVNRTGSTLPSTGGMGTTMIYIAGAILMVGAAIIFVTNKRMKHE